MSTARGIVEQQLTFGGDQLRFDGDDLVYLRSASAAIDSFLPLSEVKAHLQLDPASTAMDTELKQYRTGAVSFCEGYLGFKIITTVFDKAVYARGSEPMYLGERHLSSVRQVRYWTTEDKYMSEEPDVTLTNDDLGRIGFYSRGRLPSSQDPRIESGRQDSYILWPVSEWPKAAYGSLFSVTLDVGLPAADSRMPGIRTAVLLMIRETFEGYRVMSPNHAVYRHLDALQ